MARMASCTSFLLYHKRLGPEELLLAELLRQHLGKALGSCHQCYGADGWRAAGLFFATLAL